MYCFCKYVVIEISLIRWLHLWKKKKRHHTPNKLLQKVAQLFIVVSSVLKGWICLPILRNYLENIKNKLNSLAWPSMHKPANGSFIIFFLHEFKSPAESEFKCLISERGEPVLVWVSGIVLLHHFRYDKIMTMYFCASGNPPPPPGPTWLFCLPLMWTGVWGKNALFTLQSSFTALCSGSIVIIEVRGATG